MAGPRSSPAARMSSDVPSPSLEIPELQHPFNNSDLKRRQNVDFDMDDRLSLGNGCHREILCPNIGCLLITLPGFRSSHTS